MSYYIEVIGAHFTAPACCVTGAVCGPHEHDAGLTACKQIEAKYANTVAVLRPWPCPERFAAAEATAAAAPA